MISSCRICDARDMRLILTLGELPLPNALLRKGELKSFESIYPLDLVFCEKCFLVQIAETVSPEKLFREYLYFSSFSETMLKHVECLVTRLIPSRSLDKNSLIVEIASNDGYLLQYYKKNGIPVLGIEPAVNIAKIASEKGIRSIHEFFDDRLALELSKKGERADVIHAHNVLAHAVNLNGFVEGIRILLKDNGLAVIEVPYVKDMIDHCEFDTIYHEHLSYFLLTTLVYLFKKHDLIVTDVERISIHGGSLRIFVTHQGQGYSNNAVRSLLEEESRWGVDKIEFYNEFGARVEEIKRALLSQLNYLKQEGKSIAAYGASAKGSILLNYCGIGNEFIDFVVDRSPYKQGLYMPGVRLPIYSPAKLLEVMPDYVLLLTWNFADEILKQQHEYQRRGGQFIIPIPKIKIVSLEEKIKSLK